MEKWRNGEGKWRNSLGKIREKLYAKLVLTLLKPHTIYMYVHIPPSVSQNLPGVPHVAAGGGGRADWSRARPALVLLRTTRPYTILPNHSFLVSEYDFLTFL